MVTAAAIILSGCSAPQELSPQGNGSYGGLPLPNGATIIAPIAATGGTAPPEPQSPAECGALASLRPAPPGAASAGGAVAAIRARGRLIVGVDQSTNLMSFRDPVTGTLSGFDVDIAREIARDLLGDPSRIEFRLLTSAARLDALESNDVDIVARTFTITCERAERIAFSTVYFRASQRLLVRADAATVTLESLANRRVCSLVDTPSLDAVQRLVPTATIVAVRDLDDCLIVLQQRQADAASTDDVILAGMAVQDPHLEVTGPELQLDQYGIGVNKDHDDLVRAANGTLERVRSDGTWMRLYDRWLAAPLGPVAGPPTPTYRD
ncbi:glutamate ABC transporter substrate-binding protein [Rhodococcus sp. NPDC057014]|uniref:glutamate ABC transporter substrate-binding protein n=1 Tax=Rhodococcus sp. NPDC057014 TaxID=3346000 RepID=UPI003645C24C